MSSTEHVYSPHIPLVIGGLMVEGCRRATRYVSPTFTVKATAMHRGRAGERNHSVLVTWGKPNWHERQRIKQFLKVGEPFPVKKVQLQYWPAKRKR